MEKILQDIRYGLKLLLKEKAFSATVLLTLAVCIWANSTIFSVINTVMLKPLPYDEPDQLVTVFNSYPGAGAERASTSAPDFFMHRDDVPGLEELELGTDWFLYWKNASNGAVSDITANRRSGYLGWEMDYFANWRVTSDLSWTARLGVFFPGSAFSDRSTRTFFLVGVTWSF